MYKLSIYLVVTYFLLIILCMRPIEVVTKEKPNTNSFEVHPQLNNNGHPMDVGLVGIGSL